MTKKLKIYWIDDDHKRKVMAENLAKQMDYHCEFVNIKNKNFLSNISEHLRKAKSCKLIIIDHRLDQVQDKSVISGPSATEIIRQKIPEIPIISVTAMDILDINSRTKQIYDDIISGSRLSDNYLRIRSLIDGYLTIRKNIPKSKRQYLNLLHSPALDEDRLYDILPDTFKMGLISKGSIKQLADWIRKVLMTKPGFLINNLWAATYSGVRFNSFNKIIRRLTESEYDGVFANHTDRRWWKSLLVERILSLNEEYDSIYPWEAARGFSELNSSDYSRCEYCNEYFPEIVGYTDENAETPIQLHLKCSVPHPKFEKLLFFEEIRIIKE